VQTGGCWGARRRPVTQENPAVRRCWRHFEHIGCEQQDARIDGWPLLFLVGVHKRALSHRFGAFLKSVERVFRWWWKGGPRPGPGDDGGGRAPGISPTRTEMSEDGPGGAMGRRRSVSDPWPGSDSWLAPAAGLAVGAPPTGKQAATRPRAGPAIRARPGGRSSRVGDSRDAAAGTRLRAEQRPPRHLHVEFPADETGGASSSIGFSPGKASVLAFATGIVESQGTSKPHVQLRWILNLESPGIQRAHPAQACGPGVDSSASVGTHTHAASFVRHRIEAGICFGRLGARPDVVERESAGARDFSRLELPDETESRGHGLGGANRSPLRRLVTHGPSRTGRNMV